MIDSLEFARNGRTLSGEIAVGDLPRLVELLTSSEGSIRYAVRGMQVDGKSFLLLDLSGICHLRCQRCLDDLTYPVDITSRLQLLEGEDLMQDDASDEIDGIEASQELDVIGLVEDELLLSLPFAPRHDEGVCELASKGSGQADDRFGILAQLKHK
ncbi:MAG: YceD family protein [Sideroxydans sp.]|nr:YceD family protein [Sideroxydans sp.]MDD5471693.1 YceD family protein [Sideroxydans sp.]